MDTKTEETIGLMHVTGILLKHGVLLASPMFDQLGGDLLGFTMAGDKAAISRIQVKYRDCTKRTPHIDVPLEYVTGAFVLFICLKTSTGDQLFCLLPEEVKKYAAAKKLKTKGKDNAVKEKDVYRFVLTEKLVAALAADASLKISDEKIKTIKATAEKSSAAADVYKEFLGMAATAAALIEAQQRVIRLSSAMRKIAVAKAQIELTDQTNTALDEVLKKLKENMGGEEDEGD